MDYFERLRYEPSFNATRLQWDLRGSTHVRFEDFWKEKHLSVLPPELFSGSTPIWLEVGAGSGGFFAELAALHPERRLIAMERSRLRGKRLVRKVQKTGLPNLIGLRANAIPALIHNVPSARIERIYLLYPCPWPKNAQRKNRWYLHPIMPHLIRVLQPGGLLIWASDQKFFIDEARWVCEQVYSMKTLVHGRVTPNPYNDGKHFVGGRTKFERSFLSEGQACHELIVAKSVEKSSAT